MSTPSPSYGSTVPTLDVQVLQGLETYIESEKFLHTLEAASAEWIDLSDHQHQPHKGASPYQGLEIEQHQVQQGQDAVPAQSSTDKQPSSTFTSGKSGSFLSRWRRSSAGTNSSNPASCAAAEAYAAEAHTSSTGSSSQAASSSDVAGKGSGRCDESSTAVVAETTTFELVQAQGPLTESLMQEPFVLVSAEDAIEGMAYYIALYLSRAPEARYMEPKQLQAALRQTMTAIRRSRYRAIWDWGRCLYRWGAVSYSALQLYEHPWLVRAVVAGVWASSKMAFGVLL